MLEEQRRFSRRLRSRTASGLDCLRCGGTLKPGKGSGKGERARATAAATHLLACLNVPARLLPAHLQMREQAGFEGEAVRVRELREAGYGKGGAASSRQGPRAPRPPPQAQRVTFFGRTEWECWAQKRVII